MSGVTDLHDHRRAMLMVLNQKVVDVLVPEHNRTTCSDNNLRNGWYTTTTEMPRCTRCALIQAVTTGEWPEEVVASLQLHLDR